MTEEEARTLAPIVDLGAQSAREPRRRLAITRIVTGVGLLLAAVPVLGILTPSFRDYNVIHTNAGARGLVGPDTAGLIGFLLIAAVWWLGGQTARQRGSAIGLLSVALLSLAGGQAVYYDLAIVSEYAQAFLSVCVFLVAGIAGVAGVSGWLVLRQRPAKAFIGLIVVPIGVLLFDVLLGQVGFAPTFWLWAALLILLNALTISGATWIAWLVSRVGSSVGRDAQRVEQRDQAQLEAHARAITQWQQAYALANPGQPVPVPPLTLAPTYGTDGTNTLAILSLVFGVLGGYLAIIFGHIALSQIKRTGEQGRGLALAGLILGYSWVGAFIILIVASLILGVTSSH